MWRSFAARLSGAPAVAAVAGTAYLVLALARVVAFSRRRRRGPRPRHPGERVAFAPPITVIKPLHGAEAGLEENLASFCVQDYPVFQVIFCVTNADDPAIAVAHRVIDRFPTLDGCVVVSPPAAARNPKIANALNATAHVRHDIVAMADSDMRVDAGYLGSIAEQFADAQVGAVTCLYGGLPVRHGAVGALAAMFVNDHFAPSVLVAGAVEPLRYCFGSTMAVRRDVLETIGGLRALGATLADDHALGDLVAAAGWRVALAAYAVQSVQGEATLRELCRRELRWARVIRSVRPLGSTLALVTYALPLAFVAWLARPRSFRRFSLLVLAGGLRLALHRAARDAFAPTTPLAPHLIPLRDGLALAVWAASRFGGSVEWKGQTFRLDETK